jgi:putative transposase
MEHEVQLLLTPGIGESLGRMMQALTRFYVPAFNRRHGRAGALWQGRFRAAPVGGATPLLTCMRYLEQAPFRAGWLGEPTEYVWSSAAHHCGLRADPLLLRVPAESAYWQLGNTPFDRESAYRVLLAQPLTAADVSAVEASTPRGWALGSGEFLARLGEMTGRRTSVKSRGRPKDVG